MVEVTQEDRTVADLMLIASRDYYRRCEIAARHREAALTTAQAEVAAQEQRIAALEAVLSVIARNECEVFDDDLKRMVTVSMDAEELSVLARAALSEPMP